MSFEQIRLYGLIGYMFRIGEEYPMPLFIGGTFIMMIIGYLLGSLNFAIIISKLKYRDDIRKYGSGNAGMTNMMRTYGTAAGVFTLLGDLLKGVAAVMIAELLFGEATAYITGIACILGHVFPCWYGFKGGKGVAVTAAMLLALEPTVFVVLLATFILIVLITRYISLGSIMGALLYPVALSKFYPITHNEVFGLHYVIIMICSVIIALLIVYLHRENMKRLLAGKENKFAFKKKGTQNDENINKD